MAKRRPKNELPVITAAEKEQASLRRKLGHGFAVREDEHGRERLVAGTAEAQRTLTRSKAGIFRLKTFDPLVSFPDLSPRQRNAGLRYRDAYDVCSNAGIKPASMDVKVDGGRGGSGLSAAVIDAMTEVRECHQKTGHHEIAMVVREVCGERRSIREIAAMTRDPHPALVKLLKIGLDKVAIFYFGPLTKR